MGSKTLTVQALQRLQYRGERLEVGAVFTLTDKTHYRPRQMAWVTREDPALAPEAFTPPGAADGNPFPPGTVRSNVAQTAEERMAAIRHAQHEQVGGKQLVDGRWVVNRGR